jgi:hypothetical protein
MILDSNFNYYQPTHSLEVIIAFMSSASSSKPDLGGQISKVYREHYSAIFILRSLERHTYSIGSNKRLESLKTDIDCRFFKENDVQ